MSAVPFARARESEFRQIEDGHYILDFPALGIWFDIDRLRRDRQQLIGELTVGCKLPGAKTFDGVLSVADFNLSDADARWRRAKHLIERSHADDIDWASALEELAQRVRRADLDGAPAKLLHTYERPGADVEFVVDGWRLLRDHHVIAFGDGGSAKSYLALYTAGRLAIQGVNVLYVDWELGGSDHRDRLERLFGPDMPVLHYLRCDRSIVSEADRLRREVRRIGAEYLICDSIAFATGGPPEAAEHATAYFRIIRQIGIGGLHLAHINKSDAGDQKPFGSSFWHNSARATWFIKQASASADGQRLTIGLFNRKANLTRLHPALAFQFEFTQDSTVVSPVSIADIEDLSGSLPLWQRIAHYLKAGQGLPKTIAEIAEELDAKADTVKKAVSPRRGKSMFIQIPGTDGAVRIALVDRRAS